MPLSYKSRSGGEKSPSMSKSRPAVRLFSCATCNHKLRFGVTRCGQCWQPAPLMNQTRFYVAVAGGVAVLGYAMVASGT